MPQASADEAGRAVAKAAWRILPLLGIGYLLNYVDRVNVSFASTQMNADLGFSATIYGLGAGLFYLSYSLLEIPSNMLLMRFGARRWLARIMIMWGLLAAAMLFVRTPMQFYSLRFLLGLAEAGFFPGVVFYLSQWFPTRQRGRAIGAFLLANPLASAVMGLVSGPLLALDGAAGLRGWQWLFLVQGLPAAAVGIVVFLFLPDSPQRARWLSEGERAALIAAVADHPSRHEAHSAPGPLTVLADRRAQLLGIIYLISLSTSTTFVLSAPAIIMERAGWDLSQASRLIFWTGLVGAATIVATGWITDRRGERYSALLLALTIDTAAFVIMALGTEPYHIVLGVVACLVGRGILSTSQGTLWTDVLSGPRLAIGVAAISSVANLGTFALPYAFGALRDTTGNYQAGLLLFPILHLIALVSAIALYRGRPAIPRAT